MSKDEKNSSSTGLDPFSMARSIKTRGPAPVHLWDPPFCGDIDMRIAKDGSWYHQGGPIRRMPMVKLFASILKREGDEYFLVTPVEKVRIRVEDCPFVAVVMDIEKTAEGQQRLLLTTNTGEQVCADEEHPITVSSNSETGEPHPIIHVRDGLNALINRSVFYQLVNIAQEHQEADETVSTVASAGVVFELGRG